MTHLVKVLALSIVSLVCVSPNLAQSGGDAPKQGVVLRSVPRNIDANARYLFYVSGYIVAAGNTRPTSPRFGVYEYEQILESFTQHGFVVISEARKQSAEIEPYAAQLAPQVQQLLKAGVPPQNITVIGASQGAWIAMLVSTYIANPDINFVFIGACAADDGLLKLVDLHGNVLFISEHIDLPGSCQRFRADASGVRNYKALKLNTGLKHGFLYRPLKEWIEPTIEWARGH
jgi:hypothetical protein